MSYTVTERKDSCGIQALSNITDSHTLMALWKRSAAKNISDFIQEWKKQSTFMESFESDFSSVSELSSALEKFMNTHCYSKLPTDPFVQDVIKLATIFKRHTQRKDCKLKLQWITKTMCPRYHSDFNTYRMLCTYTGEGTYWTPWDNVDWENTRSTNNLLSTDYVRQANAFDVLLMKGRAHQHTNPYGQFHRSPPASTKAPRLMLKIDPY